MVDNKQFCYDCPLQLYNRNVFIKGTGTIHTRNVIVIPYIDKQSSNADNILVNKVVEELAAVYSPTGEQLENSYYITSSIKCNYNVKLPIDDNVTCKCLNYLRYEIKAVKPRTTLLIGDSTKFVLGLNVKDTIGKIYNKNGHYYVTNYNPLCKYYNEDDYKTFLKEAKFFFTAVAYNCFNHYKLVNI